VTKAFLLEHNQPGLARRLQDFVGSLPALVSTLLWGAVALALTMAVVSAINYVPERWSGPPDEYLHRAAARYYIDHWLPPRVGEPATLDSYSRNYGLSYLNETDFPYLFAGKFAALIAPVVPNHDLGFRFFDVLLLGILAAFCSMRPAAFLIFSPLLLSPQIWYIFSYFNGDAFALFLAVLIAYQVAAPGSLFNASLDSPGLWRNISGPAVLGLLVGLLALSKRNYLSFLAFVPVAVALARLGWASALLLAAGTIAAAGGYLKWFEAALVQSWPVAAGGAALVLLAIFAFPSTRRVRLNALFKCAVVCIIAAAVIVPRVWWDVVRYGSNERRLAAISQLQEELAEPVYKPSRIYSEKHDGYYGIGLRDRGSVLRDLFRPPWSWHTKTFVSATGQYGWLEYRADWPYYLLMASGYLALLAVYVQAVVRARELAAGLGFVFVASFAALTVAAAIYHSWVDDFQAQGRYLFPIVAMLGIGLQSVRNKIERQVLISIVAACFGLSVWSFVVVGLRHIPKSY
jgi:hypothetical protein